MLGAYEAGIAVLLEQQSVDVLGGIVKCESRWCFQFLLCLLHGLAIDVDLTRGTRSQELSSNSYRNIRKRQNGVCIKPNVKMDDAPP